MKQGSILLLALMVFCLYSDITAQIIDLDRYCQGYPQPDCPKNYDPHCGSDGTTYANQCTFCNEYFYSGKTLQLRHLGECAKSEN